MTSPESQKLKLLNLKLSAVIAEYQEMAAETSKPTHEVVMMSLCDRLQDTLHSARKCVPMLEVV